MKYFDHINKFKYTFNLFIMFVCLVRNCKGVVNRGNGAIKLQFHSNLFMTSDYDLHFV